jgi:uncharacterized repeat protein (TIGR01451 family)
VRLIPAIKRERIHFLLFNAVGAATATDVAIKDILLLGFTYDSTVGSISLNAGASRTGGFTNPNLNDQQPTWNNFILPGGSQIVIRFIANTNPGLVARTYQNYAQAQVGTGDSPTVLASYDSNSSTAEDVTLTTLPSVNPNDATALDKFVHNLTTVVGVPVNDKNCYWPTATPDAGNTNLCTNTYTIGEVNGGKVKPGDTIEYTVYFVNAGGADAKNVKICDLLRPNQTYLPGSLRLQLGGGTTLSLTDANDPTIDRGQFVPANDPDPAKTDKCNLTGPNNNGVVAIDLTGTTGSPTLTTMPSATSAGFPALSSGWFRFRAKVNN